MMALAPLSARFQSLPLLSRSNWSPLVLIPEWVGLWVNPHSRPLWVLQQTFLWVWEFLLLPPQPPRVFSVIGFEALFPCAGTLGCMVCFTPVPFLPVYLCANVGSASCSLACPVPQSTTSLGLTATALSRVPSTLDASLHPSDRSGWMFLFLSLWFSDFHTVRFSVSSGCFLFLNCCPSFGCARRHSVSTYASILAGSPKNT